MFLHVSGFHLPPSPNIENAYTRLFSDKLIDEDLGVY